MNSIIIFITSFFFFIISITIDQVGADNETLHTLKSSLLELFFYHVEESLDSSELRHVQGEIEEFIRENFDNGGCCTLEGYINSSVQIASFDFLVDYEFRRSLVRRRTSTKTRNWESQTVNAISMYVTVTAVLETTQEKVDEINFDESLLQVFWTSGGILTERISDESSGFENLYNVTTVFAEFLDAPSVAPSRAPSIMSSSEPSLKPNSQPSMQPTSKPSTTPTSLLTKIPTITPTNLPTIHSSIAPTTSRPDTVLTNIPTLYSSGTPTMSTDMPATFKEIPTFEPSQTGTKGSSESSIWPIVGGSAAAVFSIGLLAAIFYKRRRYPKKLDEKSLPDVADYKNDANALWAVQTSSSSPVLPITVESNANTKDEFSSEWDNSELAFNFDDADEFRKSTCQDDIHFVDEDELSFTDLPRKDDELDKMAASQHKMDTDFQSKPGEDNDVNAGDDNGDHSNVFDNTKNALIDATVDTPSRNCDMSEQLSTNEGTVESSEVGIPHLPPDEDGGCAIGAFPRSTPPRNNKSRLLKASETTFSDDTFSHGDTAMSFMHPNDWSNGSYGDDVVYGIEDGISKKSKDVASRMSITTNGSNSTTHRLIKDLVWLEKRIANHRKVSSKDSESQQSQTGLSTIPQESKQEQENGLPSMKSILIRDFELSPGPLNFSIDTVTDGPVVSNLDEKSELFNSGLRKGDVIIAVDQYDTRNISAEHVQKYMINLKTSYKITVLHFNDNENVDGSVNRD